MALSASETGIYAGLGYNYYWDMMIRLNNNNNNML
jgi:hypothetical protein